MWAAQILMAVIGLSSGIVVAGGLFSLIAGLGVISDLQTERIRESRSFV